MVNQTTDKQELEAALAGAERRYEEARATGGDTTLLIALIADVRERARDLEREREREREREFLRRQALSAAPPGNPMWFLY